MENMIMNYSKNYYEEIFTGLEKTVVTDLNGIEIPYDEAFEQWVDECESRKHRKGIFFFCGNGASETMAEHLSHDCFQNADFLTYTCSETSYLTAISNDISYEDVLAYRIKKMLSKKDMLITISSSGNSPNIIKAIQTARELGVYIVTISGKGADNKSRTMGDLNFYVPLPTYGTVESAHAVLLHCWLDRYLDKYGNGRH